MSNILLIEPDYRSKFPPLGLMKIAAFHKERGDAVTFARGKVRELREANWHRIYVSSLFTWELPRTLATIKYYLPAVENAADIFVGGIGVTLQPDYIRKLSQCVVIEGPLDKPDMLGPGTPPIAHYIPDYSILDSVSWKYKPEDSYFCRVTKGCVRKCKFCAVPKLEPVFGYSQSLGEQIQKVQQQFGERQHLVLMDNNILATDRIEQIIEEIRQEGFEAGAIRNKRYRTVDFNQGIDARLIDTKIAKALSTICLSTVRLAFDSDTVEKHYLQAIHLMADVGFKEFTTYVMFNFDDTPLSLYRRLKLNTELSQKLGIRITGFPMKYIPTDDINRRYVSPEWKWRYLRGIQCVLLATHGMVSPNPEFFGAAFGKSYEEFLEIISMPDRYIIYRRDFENNEAAEWQKLFKKLSLSDREEFLSTLASLHTYGNPEANITSYSNQFEELLSHYYPSSGKKSEVNPLNNS